MDEISKKDLLTETGISYGQLYRWKREGLIPEEWFSKRSSFTGQETWFPRERMLERVKMILETKDDMSLEEIRWRIEGISGGELDGLEREALNTARAIEQEKPVGIVLFETNDGKHFVVLAKNGTAFADGGVKILWTLAEKELSARLKAMEKSAK